MRSKSDPQINYSKLFNKQYKIIPLEIKIAFQETLELFLDNHNHPILRNHALKEKLQGYKSINVTEDYRAIYKIKLEGKKAVITFYLIGTHEELYGK